MPHSDGKPHYDGLDDARQALTDKMIANNGLVPPGTSKEEAEAADAFVERPENLEHVQAMAALVEVAFALGLLCEACAFRRGVVYGVILAKKLQNQDKLDYQAIIDALNKGIEQDGERGGE